MCPLTLAPTGWHLVFPKEMLEVAHDFCRVGGGAGAWQRVAMNARSPYHDQDVFAPGTQLRYYVQHESQ